MEKNENDFLLEIQALKEENIITQKRLSSLEEMLLNQPNKAQKEIIYPSESNKAPKINEDNDFNLIQAKYNQSRGCIKALQERCDNLLSKLKDQRTDHKQYKKRYDYFSRRNCPINDFNNNLTKHNISYENCDRRNFNAIERGGHSYHFRSDLDGELFGSNKIGNEFAGRFNRNFIPAHKAFFDDSSISSSFSSSDTDSD